MKRVIFSFLAGAVSLVVFAVVMMQRKDAEVRQTADYGKFSGVAVGMGAPRVLEILGPPSCAQPKVQLERSAGPVCAAYRDQPPADQMLVYLQGDFVARIHFDSRSEVSRVELLALSTHPIDAPAH